MSRPLSFLVVTLALVIALRPAADPLASWNDCKAKQAILNFVAKVTEDGSRDFVPVADRIAVFDNDGTLWSEQPMYNQLAFALDRVKVLAPRHPEWQLTEPLASLLKGDLKNALAGGQKALLEIVAATHAGMTTEEFEKTVREWIATARHPKTGRPYTEMVYLPMIELLAYLPGTASRPTSSPVAAWSSCARGRRRPTASRPSRSSAAASRPGLRSKRASRCSSACQKFSSSTTVTASRLRSRSSSAGPDLCNRQLGRRSADARMDGHRTGTRFMGLVHHTDAAREWAYDRTSSVGRLDHALAEAQTRGWTVVDIREDWMRSLLSTPGEPLR